MNLSQLHYFKKLAEVLHYTRAAQELFITQPTLSGAISSLENELEVSLFERSGRSVSLTLRVRSFTSMCALRCAPSTTVLPLCRIEAIPLWAR